MTKQKRKQSSNQIYSIIKPSKLKTNKESLQFVNKLSKDYWNKGIKNTTILKRKTLDLENEVSLKDLPKRRLFTHKQTMYQIEYENSSKCNTSRSKNEVR